MNRLSPRAGYYVISVGIALQFLGLAIDALDHGRQGGLDDQSSILSLSSPGQVLLVAGLSIAAFGAIVGLVSLLTPETLAAVRALAPAAPPLALAAVAIGSVIFAYSVDGSSQAAGLEAITARDHAAFGLVTSTDPDAPAVTGCPPGTYWHPQMNHCMPLATSSAPGAVLGVVTAEAQLLCPEGTYWHAQMDHCMPLAAPTTPAAAGAQPPEPSATPYVMCPAGTYWHQAMGHCMPLTSTPAPDPTGTPTPTCPEGFFWHPAMGHCMPVAGTPPSFTPPSGTPLPTLVCPTGYVWSLEAGDCIAIPPTPTAIP